MRAVHADERWTVISTTSIHVEMPLSRQRSDHIHELHVHDDGDWRCRTHLPPARGLRRTMGVVLAVIMPMQKVAAAEGIRM